MRGVVRGGGGLAGQICFISGYHSTNWSLKLAPISEFNCNIWVSLNLLFDAIVYSTVPMGLQRITKFTVLTPVYSEAPSHQRHRKHHVLGSPGPSTKRESPTPESTESGRPWLAASRAPPPPPPPRRHSLSTGTQYLRRRAWWTQALPARPPQQRWG